MKQSFFAHFRKDLNAGVVVFLVAVPLCLGIALASKAPLMSGILAGVIGGVVVGLLSGSQLGVSGPAAGLVTMTIAGVAACGSFEAFCLATAIAGGIQLLLGLVGAGTIARFFPTSVIKGMLAAIGIIIVLKQIPHLVGLDSDYEGDMDFLQSDGHTTLSELTHLFDSLTPGSILIGVVSLAFLVVWSQPIVQRRKVLSLIPGPLLAVILGITMQEVFVASGSSMALQDEHLVHIEASRNPIDWISLPDFSAIGNQQVWIYGLLIALIASVESLLCAEATDKIDPQMRVANKNRELLAQGVGNVLSGMVGGLPVTQVIVRSSANVMAGGLTRLSTIVHGLLILAAVIALPSVLNMIPMASLAAILILVGYNLAKPTLFVKYFKKGWTQFLPFLLTIPAVLLTDLLTGVGIGIALSLVFILMRSVRAPFQSEVEEDAQGLTVRFKLGPIVSFLNKGAIIEALELVPEGSRVSIDATGSLFIDPDIVEAIEDFASASATREIAVQIEGSLVRPKSRQRPVKVLRKALSQHSSASKAAH